MFHSLQHFGTTHLSINQKWGSKRALPWRPKRLIAGHGRGPRWWIILAAFLALDIVLAVIAWAAAGYILR
jgi:hypothetical protein